MPLARFCSGMPIHAVHMWLNDMMYQTCPAVLEDKERRENKLNSVTVQDVSRWLLEMDTCHFSDKFSMKEVVAVFDEECISGLALPAVNMEFLVDKCHLKTGDAYLLMQEIEHRRGAVIHWVSED